MNIQAYVQKTKKHNNTHTTRPTGPAHTNTHQQPTLDPSIKLANRSRGRPEGSLFVSFYQLVGEGTSPFPCVSTI